MQSPLVLARLISGISYHHCFFSILWGLVLLALTPFSLHAQYSVAPLACEPKDPESAMQCVCNPKLLPSGQYRWRVLNKTVGKGQKVADPAAEVRRLTVSNCGREIDVPYPGGGILTLKATRLEDDVPVRFQGFKKGVGRVADADWDYAVVTGSVQSTGAHLSTPARAELNGSVAFKPGFGVPDITARTTLTLLNPFEETIEETLVGEEGTAKVNRQCECAKVKRFKERMVLYQNAWKDESVYQQVKAAGMAKATPSLPYMDFDGVVRFPAGYEEYEAGKISLEELNGKYSTYQKEVNKNIGKEKEKLARERCEEDRFPDGGASTNEDTCEINLDAAALFAAGVPASGIRSMRMHEEVHQKYCLNYKSTLTAAQAIFAKNSPERVRAEEIEATDVQLNYMDEWMGRHCETK